MSTWSIAMPALAMAAIVALVFRIYTGVSPRTRDMLLSLLSLIGCLSLNTPGIYSGVDSSLGGHNVAYLLVQVLWCAFLGFLVSSIFSNSRFVKSWVYIGLTFATIVQIVSSIILASQSTTDYRILNYRENFSAIMLVMSTNVYSAILATCSGFTLLHSSLLNIPSRELLRRIGLGMIGAGLLMGVVTVMERIIWPTASPTHLTIDGALVLCALALVLLGLLVTFADLWRQHRRQRLNPYHANQD